MTKSVTESTAARQAGRISPPGPNNEPYVYFLYDFATDLIKIGTSRTIDKRVSELVYVLGRPLDFLGSIPGGVDVERSLHQQFDALRVVDEWFMPREPLTTFIETHCPTSELPDQEQARREYLAERDRHRNAIGLNLKLNDPQNEVLLQALSDLLGIDPEQLIHVDIKARWWDTLAASRHYRAENAK